MAAALILALKVSLSNEETLVSCWFECHKGGGTIAAIQSQRLSNWNLSAGCSLACPAEGYQVMRYDFHFRLHGARVEDTIGLELVDLESAISHARGSAAKIMRGNLAGCVKESAFEVADVTAKVYLTVPLQELSKRIVGAAPVRVEEGIRYRRPGI